MEISGPKHLIWKLIKKKLREKEGKLIKLNADASLVVAAY